MARNFDVSALLFRRNDHRHLAAWIGHRRSYEHSAAHFWLADVGDDPLNGSGVGDERNARIGVRYCSRSGHCLSKS